MSYSWGFIKTDKQVRATGAIIVGMFLCFVIGIPLSRILEYYEFEVPFCLFPVFAVI
jgi:predicted MFS family arabinose efflux permease